MSGYSEHRWRVGRKTPRTVYAQLGVCPDDSDVLIGTMDTAELAAKAVEAHNERIAVTSPINPMGQDIRYR